MRRLPLALLALAVLAPVADARDYSTTARSVLVPGNGGTVPLGPNSLDQKALYDDLTPLMGNVTAADLNARFKPNVFGTKGQGPTTVEKTTNKRVRIVVDKWGVPHITAAKREDVFFGVGWMFAKERSLLGELARGPGRLTLLDPPGIDAFSIITSLRTFQPSAEANAFANRQLRLLTRKKASPKLKRLRRDIAAYVKGINAQYKDSGNTAKPWTMTDFVAVAGFIGSIFGRGGGDEARRSMFLDALMADLGEDLGLQVFNDLRTYKDQESNTSIAKSFFYGTTDAGGIPEGAGVLENGSFTQTEYAAGRKMSNAQLTSRGRSAAGRPVFVAGPQLGYYYPEIVYEVDIHSGDGIDARGISSAGAGPYVFIGRGQDFSWSLTSANNDIIDTYIETLCGGSETKYMYKGKCRDMTTVNAGVLKGNAETSDQTLQWFETVHGPVQGYATVGGNRVAITERRSTRGREIRSLLAFQDLNSNKVRSAKDFLKTMPQLEHTFNAFYADEKDIAFISTGRLPLRQPSTHPGLPVDGTGAHEWTGFLKAKDHPQQINPPSGTILNWNNLPAPGWGAADDEWGYHRLHRNRLFLAPAEATEKHTPASVVGVMNVAATQDVRAQLMPALEAVLDTSAPTPALQQLFTLLQEYDSRGSHRLDADGDGKYDEPGAAVWSAWWVPLAKAVMGGRLSEDLMTQLDSFQGIGNRGGSAWVGWIDKDLRTLAGQSVESKFATTYCGAGDLAACRTAIWGALEEARTTLTAEQGADPTAWRRTALDERHTFVPGVIPDTIRWTNRPTYQQVAQYKGQAP